MDGICEEGVYKQDGFMLFCSLEAQKENIRKDSFIFANLIVTFSLLM
jgi:hypothetical protein